MFKDELKAIRQAENLTRQAASQRLKDAGIEVHPNTIQAWENGRSEPPLTRPEPKPTQAEILAALQGKKPRKAGK